jgi:hypothetical protein
MTRFEFSLPKIDGEAGSRWWNYPDSSCAAAVSFTAKADQVV